MTFYSSYDASSLAKASLIAKFRALVSKFPVLEAAASSTFATIISHFYLLLIFHYFSKNSNNASENSSAYWKIDPCPAFG